MNKTTVLQTIETGGPGGAETVLLNLCTRIDRESYRCLALVPYRGWLSDRLESSGVETLAEESLGAAHPVGAILRVVRERNVDIIHAHLADQNFFASVAGLLCRRAVVATYHGFLAEDRRGLRRNVKLLGTRLGARTVVGVSNNVVRELALSGFQPSRLVCVYNGVDVARFSAAPAPVRHQLGLGAACKLVGMVANMRAQKNYDLFVRAARIVIDQVPEAKFLAIGDVDEHIGRRVRELCDTMGLGGAFFILGFRDDVPNVLAALDLFALSSSAEGFSIATIEAMAAGRPVVVTRSGGPQEIIEHGRTGLLVDPNDPHSMAESIVFLLRHPERAQKMAMDARADVEAKFSLEKMVKEYEAIYLRLTSGANGRRPGLSRSFS